MLSIPPPQRPPSRSERLLRETLRRDVEVRDSPPRRPSLTRHSTRVASPPLPPLPPLDLYSRPSSPGQRCRYAELVDEQYTRGNFHFRSPVANASNSPEGFYTSRTESEGTVTPGSRARFTDGKRAHTSSRLTTRSSSPSPPPTRSGATVTRRHSLQRAFYHEPLTPQEHALRARLENMLRPTSSAHMTNPNMAWETNGELQWRDSDLAARSGSVSQPRSAGSVRLVYFPAILHAYLLSPRSPPLLLPQLPSLFPPLHPLSKPVRNARTLAAGAQQILYAPLLTQITIHLPTPPHVLGQVPLQIRPRPPLPVALHQCQASRRGETVQLPVLPTNTTLLTNHKLPRTNTHGGNMFPLKVPLRLQRMPPPRVSAPEMSWNLTIS